MADPADFNSGAELNDIAEEAQAGPSARSGEEWLDSDEALGATQLPAIRTLSTAVGRSTQCLTESVNECLLLVTTVTVCDDNNDEGPMDAAEVLAGEATIGKLLLGDTDDVTGPALHAVTATNIQHTRWTQLLLHPTGCTA